MVWHRVAKIDPRFVANSLPPLPFPISAIIPLSIPSKSAMTTVEVCCSFAAVCYKLTKAKLHPASKRPPPPLPPPPPPPLPSLCVVHHVLFYSTLCLPSGALITHARKIEPRLSALLLRKWQSGREGGGMRGDFRKWGGWVGGARLCGAC